MKAYYTSRDYADNRFQRLGVEKQMNANSYWAAKAAYIRSCELCCSTGCCGAVKCAGCPIRGAFLDNAGIFWEKLQKQEKEFVQKERDLL